MNLDADLVAAFGALAALPIAVFAAYTSKRADARSKVAARTQVFLALRTRFLDVHARLPGTYADPDWQPRDQDEQSAATRYWHHAFDEWYITNRLDAELLSDMWREFFEEGVLSGLLHNGLRLHLCNLTARRAEHAGLWTDFASEIERAWMAMHPHGQGACRGLQCEHRRKEA